MISSNDSLIGSDADRKSAFRRACEVSAKLSSRLVPVIGPIDAAGALIASAIDVLRTEIGGPATVNYLNDLAAELADDAEVKLQ